jgi:hypothetical protein
MRLTHMSIFTITVYKQNGVSFEIPMSETAWCHAQQAFVNAIKRAEAGIWLVLCEDNSAIDWQQAGITQTWGETRGETATEQAQNIVSTCKHFKHDYTGTTGTHLATLLSILFAENGYSVSLVYAGNTGTICAAYTPE